MHLDRLGVAGREDRGTGADVGAGVEYLFEGQANCWKVGVSDLHEAEIHPIPSRDPVPREPHRLLRRLRHDRLDLHAVDVERQRVATGLHPDHRLDRGGRHVRRALRGKLSPH
jgi:hypothetical protein